MPGCANGRRLGRGFEWKVGQILLILSPFPISACENKACLLLVFSLLVIGPGCQKEGWKYFWQGIRAEEQDPKKQKGSMCPGALSFSASLLSES